MSRKLPTMSTYAAGQPIGLDEYFAFDIPAVSPDHTRDELVDGILVVNPLPSGPHQSAAAALIAMLWNACPPELVVMGEMSWVLKTEPLPTVRAADINVVTIEQARANRLATPPALAIEIVSPDSSVERDLVTKRHEYAAAGCVNYWVVFPARPELIRFELVDSSYREVGRTSGRRRVRVTAPFPVTIDLSRLPVL